MKRLLVLLLALLLLCACAREEEPAPMVQPVQFFYRTAHTDFTAEDGVIRAEVRDLGNTTWSDDDIFRLWFAGPRSDGLILPVSQDTVYLSAARSGGRLELWLAQSPDSPAEFDRALTCACLARTALSLEGVREVVIHRVTPEGLPLEDVTLTAADILQYDSGEAPESMELTLYYAEEGGELLLTEKREIPLLSAEELPAYAMQQLLEPPQSGGMRSALPAGTAVLDLRVEDGLCTVDFNGDFYRNRPETEQGEQLALLSVVNTLCELDGVNGVQFYTQGRKLERYVFLDLSAPWTLDGAAVGPIREEMGEFSAAICLPGPRDELLHRVEVRVRARSGASRETALLLALFDRAGQNGLRNPLYGAEAPRSVSTSNGLCTVELAAGTLPADTVQRQAALRALAATLCSLRQVQSVEVLEDGERLTPAPLRPEWSWFFADSAAVPKDQGAQDVSR